ncbi:hypothetical protein ACM46_11960 [Chryseobacterium angstadtii]|uniref:Lipoprotein n=1 Tax=Chryseobacterium angstadtii TaxID=558151 RepID=A0A0J7L786_9FLAO|nr:hypothetical protein [Chryseobacterium angstadtii]KMQ64915.1 hypothetical protein ACM46_11960 [Chryseobacterium angstadtii]
MKNLFPAIALLSLVSCKKELPKDPPINEVSVKEEGTDTIKSKTVKDALYMEFKPKTISNLKISGFDVSKAFSIGENTIAVGSYSALDGKITLPDTEENFGKRLLLLNNKNQIIYTSQGSGEAYLYEPHFYKNNQNGNIIIVCQQAFEYFFGGDAYLLQSGTIKHIGNLDIEPNNEEKSLTDILKIKESKDEIIFTFNADSLVLKPGNEDIIIKNNNNTQYIYNHQSLKLHQ